MSKIADRIILIPEKVKINLGKGVISAEGPLGKSEELSLPNDLEITKQENKLSTKSDNSALAGTYNALISNLIKGVTEGHEKVVEVKGVGYKVLLKAGKLEFALGKSIKKDGSLQDQVDIPDDLEVKLDGNKVIIKGKNKQKTNSFAANIRRLRPPSIYKKNKGIYYLGEAETFRVKSQSSKK